MDISILLLTVASFIGIPAIISGLVICFFSRRIKDFDHRGDRRKQETMLILRGLLIIGGLASATSRAVKDGEANGFVTEAMDAYSQYREDLSAFLVEQTARKG